MALRDRGWRVVNLACGLGQPGQEERREAELAEACRRAEFGLLLPPSASDAGPAHLAPRLRTALTELRPSIVLSPGPHELHPTHAKVAAAVRDALAGLGPDAPHLWTWALWGSLRQPTLATAFDRPRLEEIFDALGAHEGEIERVDYRRAIEGRGAMQAALAGELLFGFGGVGFQPEYAELLTEAIRAADGWRLARPRWLDPDRPLGEDSGDPACLE
jgi:LmbE family N-acetylglucosaminyl deacetylase